LVTDEQARGTANEILSARAFTRWDTDYQAWLTFLEQLADLIPDWLIETVVWISEGFESILDRIADFLGFFGVFGDAREGIGWLAVCVLAAAFIALGWRWRHRATTRAAPAAERRQPGRDHAAAMTSARTLARSGHYLAAAHRVQLATLALLIEFDWLELARSDPNRTLRDRVRDSAIPKPEARRLIELVDRLEMLWFSERREDRTLFEDWQSLDERIVAVASGRPT
jgi:hypothetical protein